MQGYIDLPNPFIYPLQGYIRGFIILRLFFTVYPTLYSWNLTVVLPYPTHCIWSYSYFTLTQPLLAAPLSYPTPSTRRTWSYSYFTLSEPLLAAPHRTLTLPYPEKKQKSFAEQYPIVKPFLRVLQLSTRTLLGSAIDTEAPERFHDCLQNFELFFYRVPFCKTLLFFPDYPTLILPLPCTSLKSIRNINFREPEIWFLTLFL